jgi:RNA polymerase sigma factor (sigma-70 family)
VRRGSVDTIGEPIASGNEPAKCTAASAKEIVEFTIEQNMRPLLSVITFYVYKAGLAKREPLSTITNEVLNETVAEALTHVDRYDPSRRPVAWLLGIAANVIKRRQVEEAKRTQREPLASELSQDNNSTEPDHASFFDQFASQTVPVGQRLEDEEATAAMLGLVSPDDAKILRLAVLQELSGEKLGLVLGITPGAARVRLHRALNRLREALMMSYEGHSHGV